MNEYCCAVSWQYDVWSSGELPDMEAEAQAVPMKEGPNFQFRFGVSMPDSRHHAAARGPVHHVGHVGYAIRDSRSCSCTTVSPRI